MGTRHAAIHHMINEQGNRGIDNLSHILAIEARYGDTYWFLPEMLLYHEDLRIHC